MATFKNCNVTGADVGFLVHKSVNATFDGCSATGGRVGFFEYENADQLNFLLSGAQKHPEELKELEKSVSALNLKTKSNIRRVIKLSSIAAILSMASDSSQVYDFLMSHIIKVFNM